MIKEEFRDKVKKIMGVKSEVIHVDWVKMADGQYYITLAFRANPKQVTKLKPILSEFYQQELT